VYKELDYVLLGHQLGRMVSLVKEEHEIAINDYERIEDLVCHPQVLAEQGLHGRLGRT
jgi:hypothetical protein